MNLWCVLPWLLVLDFTSDFRIYEYYRIYCLYLALSFVSTCFLCIILSYLFIPALTYLSPEYFLLDIICYKHTCVLTLLSSVLDTCAHPDSPPGLHITTRLGSFTDSPGFSCPGQWSLERVDSPSCWSEQRSGSVDPQPIIQSSILPGPLWASRVSF